MVQDIYMSSLIKKSSLLLSVLVSMLVAGEFLVSLEGWFVVVSLLILYTFIYFYVVVG